MLSQTAEYALRAVVHLATKTPTACTVRQIAQATQIPPAYLAKVLQRLIRAGILRSRRGLGGGVSITRPLAEVTLLDVVNAVDAIHRITHCPLNLQTHGVNLCPLHKRVDGVLARVEEMLRSTAMCDLLSESRTSDAECGFGQAAAETPED